MADEPTGAPEGVQEGTQAPDESEIGLHSSFDEVMALEGDGEPEEGDEETTLAEDVIEADGAEVEPAVESESTEPPADETVPGDPEPEDINPYDRGFAALAKREKEVRDLESSIKAREAKLGSLSEALENKDTDPLAVMRALNVDYRDIAPQIVAEGNPTGEMREKKQQSEMEELRGQVAELKQQQQQVYVKEYMTGLEKLVATDERFKAVKDFYEINEYDIQADAHGIYNHYATTENKSLRPEELAAIMQTGAQKKLQRQAAKSKILNAYAATQQEPGSKPTSTPPSSKPIGSPASGGKLESEMSQDELTEIVKKELGIQEA
ncbi:MAG: hypothetical protein GY923_15450 [Aestuariibacter sp.]|nr:hypothetical protein [Aestuariibacter sp.]